MEPSSLKTILQENQYIIQSYTLHGGCAGFQEYGILGHKVKNNIVNILREVLLNENIHEVESPVIVPYNVLKASGHVDRFTDYIVTDKSGLSHRADHLAKEWFKNNGLLEMEKKVDSFGQKELEELINHYKMLPENVVVETKNLMFEADDQRFLRPEIAQCIFVNYKQYSQFLQKDVNFGIAQYGHSFRKEISPKPFTRMREFSQFEIEYFFDPENKYIDGYHNIQNVVVPILTDQMQENGETNYISLPIHEAIGRKMVEHELLGYFLVKIYMFAKCIGLQDGKIRFRQHLKTEKAHYAVQCWDLECYVNDDWLECVGCADRGCFDLKSHSEYTGISLKAKRFLKENTKTKNYKYYLNMKEVGKVYTASIPIIKSYFDQMTQEGLLNTKMSLEKDGFVILTGDYKISQNMIKIEEFYQSHEEYYPHVIEPSFGIDRLVYSVFEQNFWVREDKKRVVLSLPQKISPYQLAIFPLIKNNTLLSITDALYQKLKNTYHIYLDTPSINIGKRYTRADEIGIKYAITVDFDTIKDNMVTIRNRDSMDQKRVYLDDITNYLL